MNICHLQQMAWVDLEGFMLGQISQRKKNAHVITYMWNVKNKLENTTKQISWHREQTGWLPEGRENWGETGCGMD